MMFVVLFLIIRKHLSGAEFGSNNPHHQAGVYHIFWAGGTEGMKGRQRSSSFHGFIAISGSLWWCEHRHWIGCCCFGLEFRLSVWSMLGSELKKTHSGESTMMVFFLKGADNKTHPPELQIQSIEKLEFKALHSELAAVKLWHHIQPFHTRFPSSTT